MNSEIKLKTPSQSLSDWLQRMPGYTKLTFICAVIAGFAAHLYMLTNKVINHDDIGHMLGSTYGTKSGRWLLPFFERLDGDFSVPWLIGVISILLLAVAACYVVSVMRIRSKVGCVLTAALIATFPTVAGTFSYMFSADAYFASFALACFAVYITNRYRFGFVAGIVCLTLSMGIYQSYFGVAAVLCVALLLLDTLDGELPMKKLLLKAGKLLLTLAIALAAYFLIVKLTTRNTGLVDYMGISEMGSLSLSTLPRLVLKAYLKYGSFFILNDMGAHPAYLGVFFALAALATLVLLVRILVLKKLKGGALALFIALLAVFPLAGNIIYVMVPEGGVHALMIFGMAFILILALSLAEYWSNTEKAARSLAWKNLGAVCSWTIAVTMALACFGYGIFSNEAYFKMELVTEQTRAFAGSLLAAVYETPGYESGMPLVIIGEAYVEPAEELEGVELTGVFEPNGIINGYTFGEYLQRFLGYQGEVYLNSSEISAQYAGTIPGIEMETYPGEDGVKVIDGAVVVKFSEVYKGG